MTPTELGEMIRAAVAAAWALAWVRWLVYHSLINWVAAITAALNDGTFRIGKVWEVFGKKIIPFAGLYYVATLAGDVILAGVLPAAVFAALELALLNDLLDSLSRVPGLSRVVDALPDALTRK